MADLTKRATLIIQLQNEIDSSAKSAATALSGLNKQADDAQKKFQILGMSTEQFGAKMMTAGKYATVGLTLPIAGVAVAATKAASDLNETSNKIQTLFGNATDSVMKFADTSAQALGQSKKQALDAAADFAVFGKAAGLAGDDLVDFSKKNVQLAADMSSFFNTSPEEAIMAIGAAFRGESEPIRRYGVLLNEASLKDEALRQGLIKTTTEALTPQQRVLAAQALIMKQTSDAQGDFERTSTGLANQSRILNAQFQDTIAALGQSLLPIAVKVTSAANELLTSFNNLSQPQKDLIMGFAAMAAAAGPMLTVGGKLVSTFSTLKSISGDMVGGLVGMGRSVGDVATYLKSAGVSADNLKFAFQALKGSGAILTAELGIIVMGLMAIAKYLGEVDAASKATTDDLLKMANSGDVFKQAAATTEIAVNGQTRLKDVVDATHQKIKEGSKDYADYKSSIDAVAKAAGYEINAQGDLVQVLYGMGGRIEKVVQANYALGESQYAAASMVKEFGGAANDVGTALGRFGGAASAAGSSVLSVAETIAQNKNEISALQQKLVDLAEKGFEPQSKQVRLVRDEIERLTKANQGLEGSLRNVQTALPDTMQAFKDKSIADAVQSIEVLKIAMSGAVSKEMEAFGAKQGDLQKKAADLKAEIDKLTGAQGAAVTSASKAAMSDTERAAAMAKLAKLQEDYTGAARKAGETETEFQSRMADTAVQIENVKGKLGEASGAVVSYVDNSKKIGELKGQYDDINKEIAANAVAHEEATKRILFDIAAQQLATIQDPTIRAKAMNELALQWGLVDKATYDATTKIIGYTDALAQDKNVDAYVTKLKGMGDEVLGVPKAVAETVDSVRKMGGEMADTKITVPVTFDKEAAAKSLEETKGDLINRAAVREVIIPVVYKVSTVTTDESTGERDKQVQAREESAKSRATDIVKTVGDSSAKVITALADTQQKASDRVKQMSDTTRTTLGAMANEVLGRFNVTSAGVSNAFMDMQKAVSARVSEVLLLIDSLPTSRTLTYKIVVQGEAPEGAAASSIPGRGAQHGADFIVPANPRGGLNDYYPVIAAPGERVIVQTPAQQRATPAGNVIYNSTVNIYDRLAAVMYLDQQRRDRLARHNARMGA